MGAKPTQVYPNISQNVKSHQIMVDGSMVSGHATYGGSQFTCVYDIDPQELANFIEDVIGYSTSAGAGQGIKRRIPAKHPELPWMYASQVSLLGGIAPTTAGSWQSANGPSADWKALRVQVQFETPGYNIAKDGAGPEWERYIVPDEDPASEFLVRPNGSFAWSAATPSPLTNQSFTPSQSQSMAQRLSKTKKTWLWIQVPDDGLFQGGFASGGRALNIEQGVGRVNDATFMNYGPGTLLLLGWKPVARTMPIDPSVLGLTITVPRCWDVQFHFLWFDPPSGEMAGTMGGHNLAPHPSNGLWYRPTLRATNSTDTSPFWRYQSYDFTKLFQMNS